MQIDHAIPAYAVHIGVALDCVYWQQNTTTVAQTIVKRAIEKNTKPEWFSDNT